MRKFIFTFFFLSPLFLFASNRLHIEANIDTINRKIHFDAFGINTERMFYRTLDDKGEMPGEITEDIMEAEDMIYRWPGGATSNFYHYFNNEAKGYGLQKDEVDNFDHPMKCNLPKGNPNCMTFEEYAPDNYVYSLLNLSDAYYQRYGKKKRVIWLPNILTFYLHNKSEISNLDKFSSLEEAEQGMKDGIISEDFFMRIKDIFDVYHILLEHSTIDLEGIEYGNEFYFHQVTTGSKFNEVNNGLSWLLNQNKYRNALKNHISLYRSTIEFLNKALFKDHPKIPTAVPVGIITKNGQQSNMNRLWNEAIRDSIIHMVDGIIHHFYFTEPDGPRINPINVEEPGNENIFYQIKKYADDFLHIRIPAVDQQYDTFFNLSETGKKMWLTEFNTSNGYFYGYFAEWQNTFMHAYFQFEAFLSFIDNENNNDVVKYAFPHLFVSFRNDYNYGAYAVETKPDGSYDKIKRATYGTYAMLGALARKEIRQISASVTNSDNLERKDLFTKVYFEPIDNNQDIVGNLIILFSNKSGEEIRLNPSKDIQFSSINYDYITLKNGSSEFLSADHFYTSNGHNYLNDSGEEDTNEYIHIQKESNISIDEDYILPGYSVGVLSFPIETEVITGVQDSKLSSSFELFPNPAGDILNIKLSESHKFNTENGWVVIDMIGKAHRVSAIHQSNTSVQMDISSLSAGMYYFILNSTDGLRTKSFVKQ